MWPRKEPLEEPQKALTGGRRLERSRAPVLPHTHSRSTFTGRVPKTPCHRLSTASHPHSSMRRSVAQLSVDILQGRCEIGEAEVETQVKKATGNGALAREDEVGHLSQRESQSQGGGR